MSVVIVNGQEDWSGIYIDGELKYETHSISLYDRTVRKLLGLDIDVRWLDDESDQRLVEVGRLPKIIEELTFEK